MLEIFDMEQRSPEWFAIRCGVPTASEFSSILAKGQGKTRLKYLHRLAGERITETPEETFESADMRRGRALEAEARALYELIADEPLQTVGFGRNRGAGASPDALVGESGILEIKTAKPSVLIPIVESGRAPGEHAAQLQGNLWVFERGWIDLMIYWPKMRPFRVRVPRDERYIDTVLAPAVERFIDDLDALVERLGGGPAPPAAPPRPEVDLATAPPAF